MSMDDTTPLDAPPSPTPSRTSVSTTTSILRALPTECVQEIEEAKKVLCTAVEDAAMEILSDAFADAVALAQQTTETLIDLKDSAISKTARSATHDLEVCITDVLQDTNEIISSVTEQITDAMLSPDEPHLTRENLQQLLGDLDEALHDAQTTITQAMEDALSTFSQLTAVLQGETDAAVRVVADALHDVSTKISREFEDAQGSCFDLLCFAASLVPEANLPSASSVLQVCQRLLIAELQEVVRTEASKIATELETSVCPALGHVCADEQTLLKEFFSAQQAAVHQSLSQYRTSVTAQLQKLASAIQGGDQGDLASPSAWFEKSQIFFAVSEQCKFLITTAEGVCEILELRAKQTLETSEFEAQGTISSLRTKLQDRAVAELQVWSSAFSQVPVKAGDSVERVINDFVSATFVANHKSDETNDATQFLDDDDDDAINNLAGPRGRAIINKEWAESAIQQPTPTKSKKIKNVAGTDGIILTDEDSDGGGSETEGSSALNSLSTTTDDDDDDDDDDNSDDDDDDDKSDDDDDGDDSDDDSGAGENSTSRVFISQIELDSPSFHKLAQALTRLTREIEWLGDDEGALSNRRMRLRASADPSVLARLDSERSRVMMRLLSLREFADTWIGVLGSTQRLLQEWESWPKHFSAPINSVCTPKPSCEMTIAQSHVEALATLSDPSSRQRLLCDLLREGCQKIESIQLVAMQLVADANTAHKVLQDGIINLQTRAQTLVESSQHADDANVEQLRELQELLASAMRGEQITWAWERTLEVRLTEADELLCNEKHSPNIAHKELQQVLADFQIAKRNLHRELKKIGSADWEARLFLVQTLIQYSDKLTLDHSQAKELRNRVDQCVWKLNAAGQIVPGFT